jgi:hypothetical protein
MMKKLTGLFAAVALMSSGVALANEGKKQDKEQTQSQGMGGSGSLGSDQGAGSLGVEQPSSTQGDIGGSGTQVGQSGMPGQLGGNQLQGRVVKSDRKTVWIEHMGAIVPLKVDKNTQFADRDMKRASDFKEGDQVRASFEVRETDNVATSISKDLGAGQGGSGSDVMMPDTGINEPLDTLPPSSVPPVDDSIGGSGNLGSDIDNQDSDFDTGSDVNPGTRTGDY